MAGLSTGCFYLEAINQRPSIDIRQTSADTVYRTSLVKLDAVANDPEDQIVFFQWRGYACVNANDFATCDSEPFYTEVLDHAEFVVPETLVDQATPVQSLLVILEAQDEYGAIARPDDRLIIPVADHAPVLATDIDAVLGGVVDTPVDLFLKVSDADDGPASVTLDWKVFTPMNQPAYDLVDLDVPDPNPDVELQVGKRITPHGEGTWNIEVVATDPIGVTATAMFTFKVGPDDPPCLAQWAPITAPSGSELPLTEPTLFQINVVNDDLDPFPTVPNNSFLGTTMFAWTIKPDSGARIPVGFTGNAVALDPATYTPGDIVELRVEIADRNNTPVNCPDNQPTCSVISDNSCIQRLTWRVEVF